MAGNGLEWVRIEAIDELKDAEAESEYITLTVRPVVNPKHLNEAVAHFFDHLSTSTFIVKRYLNHISSAVHGRNEIPNNRDTDLFDAVRNTIIGLAAREGLSGLQWKSLVVRLIEKTD